MVIAVDFDGTCVTHEFPEIGKEIGAVPVLRFLVNQGHQIVLNTMRSPRDGHRDVLREAVHWFQKHNIILHGVNENPSQKSWTKSPKVYAHLYIDDAALGIPLVTDRHERPFVDWTKVVELLCERGIITTVEMHHLQAMIQKHDETMV